jgi:hypothetical protein
MKSEHRTYGRLREEIERQHETLHGLGYLEASGLGTGRQPLDGSFWAMVLTFFRDELPKLIDGKERMDVAVPILLVIPDRIVPLAKQMRMTRIFGKPGELGNGAIHDFLEHGSSDPSPLPYVLLDVRIGADGDARRWDGDRLDRYMRDAGRIPLNAVEGVTLATHFPYLMPGGAVLTGTRWEPGTVASIHGVEPWKHFEDQPYELGRATYGYNVFGNTRAAHCARRLVRPPRR